VSIPAQGEIDSQAGEFWVENPFTMPQQRENLSAYERNKVYINRGGERFVDLSFESGADIDSDSRSVVVADFNRDHKPDLLVGNVGGGPLRMFVNRIDNASNRVKLNLVGVESNHSAIGARIIAQCDDRRIVRDVFAANGFMGQSPPKMLLGVGAARQIDQLEVRWPSGVVQQFSDVPVNCDITLTEGDDKLERVAWNDPAGE